MTDQLFPLKKLVEHVRSGKPLAAIREDYQVIASRLLNIAKLDPLESSEHLSAAIEKIKKSLEASEVGSDALALELSTLDDSLQQQTNLVFEKLLRNELRDAEQASSTPFEFILKHFSSLGEHEVQCLKEKGIFSEQDFLGSDPLELASHLGVATNIVMELMAFFEQYNKVKENLELAEKVFKIYQLNCQLNSDIEALTSDNNILIESNKNLHLKYDQIHPLYTQKIEEMKKLQNLVTTSQIECNRLAMEINFLKDERHKLSLVAEEKHLILGKLLKRIDSLKKSYDFIKGETIFSEDMLLHLESLMEDALSYGQVFGEKLENTKESLETLFSELNETIKKGKTIFYKELKQI
ncbi:MAG: hypothetical protein HQK50_09635 [Oligoflexia bacterium]|nr:hypothetical protein [Oligoflexia bacterium]